MRDLLVEGEKVFRISVPDDCKITFGPFSPPTKNAGYNRENLIGTLRIYKGKSTTDIMAVFSGVRSFRDVSINYAEQVAKEEGATIWKSDKDGYSRETKVRRETEWDVPQLPPVEEEPIGF